jgi:hypothetical protein
MYWSEMREGEERRFDRSCCDFVEFIQCSQFAQTNDCRVATVFTFLYVLHGMCSVALDGGRERDDAFERGTTTKSRSGDKKPIIRESPQRNISTQKKKLNLHYDLNDSS